MKFNTKEFGDELAGVIAAELRPLIAEVKSLRERCESLESRAPDTVVTYDKIKEMIEQAVKEIPAPANGKDGTSVTLADVAPLIEQAVKALPSPPPGKDGTSVTVADVSPLIEQAVAAAVKAIPPASNGNDGVGVAGAMIDRDGCLLLTLSNGEMKNLGCVVGKDGVSFDDFSLTYDAERNEIVVKAQSGSVAKEVRAPIKGITLGGYWRDGTKAKAQEAWSLGGCLWVAKRDTSSKPDATSDDWLLAARKGRDGEGVERTAPSTGPVKLGT